MANTLYITGELTYAKSQGLMPAFDAAAVATGIDRNLLLAVASRESNMGLGLDANWLGDGGAGMGLMQVDRNAHPGFAARHNPRNNRENVLKGAQILKAEINRYGGNLNYALPAYNAGSGNVNKALGRGLSPDAYTTGDDYGRDVLDRYSIIKSMGGTEQKVVNNSVVTVPGKPEDEAQQLVIFSGAALLSALLGTSYIATKKIKSNE
jgi:soluble lytic murein transglycosylase-like protein